MSEATRQQYVVRCYCGELKCVLCFDEHKNCSGSTKEERIAHLRDKHAEELKDEIKIEVSSGKPL